jgi:hypothetical protein
MSSPVLTDHVDEAVILVLGCNCVYGYCIRGGRKLQESGMYLYSPSI